MRPFDFPGGPPVDRHQARRDKLRKAVKKVGVDTLLVTDFTNVTYLTGFTGDDSYLLLRSDGELLLYGADSAAATNVYAGWPADACSHTDADPALRATGDRRILHQRRLHTSRTEAD